MLEYSAQGNHLHLIVEADSHVALSRGMQGLMVRLARRLNAMMGREGRLFDDHYHARLLRTPTELVRAIRYVLRNHEHHFGGHGKDPFSSESLPAAERCRLLGEAVGWLVRVGWRRARAVGEGELIAPPGWSGHRAAG